MQIYSEEEIRLAVFKHHSKDSKNIFNKNQRMASFDFCYNYFHFNRGCLSGNNLERSCMELWGYLASFGMIKGKCGLLLRNSPASLSDLIEYLDDGDCEKLWEIDTPNYNSTTIGILVDTYNEISKKIRAIEVTPTLTLVTKIMMGIWGCVPAFDRNFKKWIINDLNSDCHLKESLEKISTFYNDHKTTFKNILINTIDIYGNETSYIYSQARLIDMFGFTIGENL